MNHGTLRVIKNGQVQYISQCSCHKEAPTIDGKVNTGQEVQAVLDMFHKNISDYGSLLNNLHKQGLEHLGNLVSLQKQMVQHKEEIDRRMDDSDTFLVNKFKLHENAILDRLSVVKDELKRIEDRRLINRIKRLFKCSRP